MGEIGFEHPLDPRRCVVGFDRAVDFAAALRLRAEAAADMDVIGLGLILVVGACGLCAKKPDVADVMLRAGIRAAGEMNVEWESSCTRLSHHCAIASAWRLVSDMASRQPILPVQATSPARIEVALVERPSAAMAASASARCVCGTPEINRFCQTVSRMSPSPKS